MQQKIKAHLTVADHVGRLIDAMTVNLYEKKQPAAMALLCAISGENIFLLGPPGTAKSLVGRRLKGVFRNARSFDYLMSRFSTPDEIFGPISISRLKESDSYERLTEGYLPGADVVFLDEIWKSGPAIQNTLLTAINEHIYQNGRTTMRLPMKVLIAASNELPAAGEGLEALWDRFLVRMFCNCIADDDNFERMLLTPSSHMSASVEDDLQIDDATYGRWQAESESVGASAAVMCAVKWLRKSLMQKSDHEDDDATKADFYVSDRRWKKAFRLMQTSAYLNGRREMNLSEIVLLSHCLWNSPECCAEIDRLVANSLWRDVSEENAAINEELRSLVSPESAGRKTSSPAGNEEKDFAVVYNSYYAIEGLSEEATLITKWEYNRLSFEEESEGMMFIDNAMRLPVVQSVKINSAFSLNANTSSAKIRRVRLMKCFGGVMVDGIPYSLSSKKKSAKRSAKEMAVKRAALDEMKKRHEKNLGQWSKLQMQILHEAKANIFVAAGALDGLEAAIEQVASQFEETRIRINNTEGILS